MTDPRFAKFADILVNYCTEVKPGDKVLIDVQDTPADMTAQIVEKTDAAGGIPIVDIVSEKVRRAQLMNASEGSMKAIGDIELDRMKKMDVFINIRGQENPYELSDIPEEQMELYIEHWRKPVHLDQRVPKTRWIVARWPHPAMAAAMNVSTEKFTDFYFDTCIGIDYNKMSKAMQPLVDLVKKTDIVRITGPKTNLEFSIKGLGAVKCDGKLNIPDGEVFTAPVRDSVYGTLFYNTASLFEGKIYKDIRFKFEKGKIIDAKCSDTLTLNKILDRDEGARHIGEFAFGFNPLIKEVINDLLFDEKICGSFHLTPGKAYEDCDYFNGVDNGNRSKIHWDLVNIQTKEHGGGNIYFDGELIRKDGLFVLEELKGLNPENLLVKA